MDQPNRNDSSSTWIVVGVILFVVGPCMFGLFLAVIAGIFGYMGASRPMARGSVMPPYAVKTPVAGSSTYYVEEKAMPMEMGHELPEPAFSESPYGPAGSALRPFEDAPFEVEKTPAP